MNMRTGVWAGTALSLLLAGGAQATLLSRLGGQAVYDTDLDITWLADANLAASNTFGVSGITDTGQMSWTTANEWTAAMNTANYLGYSDWRLPNAIDTGTPGCNYAYSGTDCGYNVDLSTGEMAHLYYSTLGNVGVYDTSGNLTGGACTIVPLFCLTNTGPFSNLQPAGYWSGTSDAFEPYEAWNFNFAAGFQGSFIPDLFTYAWAVRPGDSVLETPVVPVPAAAWLLGSALGVLGALRRRAR